jgi:hypothetical protein
MFPIWSDKISKKHVSFLTRARRSLLELLEKKAPHRHNLISFIALKIIKISSREGNRESRYLNPISTRFLPDDPLPQGKRFLPTLLICAPKDLRILPYSALSVFQNLSRSESLSIVVPELISEEVRTILNELDIEAQVITDEEILEEFMVDGMPKIEKAARMQLLKLLSVISQNSKEVFVLDGDTLFLKSRAWIHDKRILFPISQEFLPRHTNFNRRHLGLESKSGLGFVTHHQVVCRECVEQIIAQAGGVNALAEKMQTSFSRIANWEDEYPSEWQFLGEFMLESNNHEVIPVRFANIGIDRKLINLKFGQDLKRDQVLEELEELANKAPGIHSISLHSYK